MTQWESYALEHKKHGYKVRVPSADKVLTTVELKLDQKDQLQEIYRHPGENDVRKSGLWTNVFFSFFFFLFTQTLLFVCGAPFLVFCFSCEVFLDCFVRPLLCQIGMVVWRIMMLTPEYPEGREIVVIGNDVTYQIGSFGPKEDILFKVRQRPHVGTLSSVH